MCAFMARPHQSRASRGAGGRRRAPGQASQAAAQAAPLGKGAGRHMRAIPQHGGSIPRGGRGCYWASRSANPRVAFMVGSGYRRSRFQAGLRQWAARSRLRRGRRRLGGGHSFPSGKPARRAPDASGPRAQSWGGLRGGRAGGASMAGGNFRGDLTTTALVSDGWPIARAFFLAWPGAPSGSGLALLSPSLCEPAPRRHSAPRAFVKS